MTLERLPGSGEIGHPALKSSQSSRGLSPMFSEQRGQSDNLYLTVWVLRLRMIAHG